MDKMSQLAQRFTLKIAQQADRAAPMPVDPNAGPKNGTEAQERLELGKLQAVGEEVKAELCEALHIQATDLKFTKLRFVDVNGAKSIEWAMSVSPTGLAAFKAGVASQRIANPTFAVAKFVTQLFGQKMPGHPVMPAQPLTLG